MSFRMNYKLAHFNWLVSCRRVTARRYFKSLPNGAEKATAALPFEEVTDAYLANSALTFHPEERLFLDEKYWNERTLTSSFGRHNRFQHSSPKWNFREVSNKFNELCNLKSELKQFNSIPKGTKPDFQRKKQLKSRLLELRSDLLLLWLAIPVELDRSVPLKSNEMVANFDCGEKPIVLEGDENVQPIAKPEYTPNIGPGAVYYSGNLAKIDQAMKDYFLMAYRKANFLQMSCPDALRLPFFLSSSNDTFPPEDFNAISCFTLKNQGLDSKNGGSQKLENTFVLCGASTQSLIGTFAKQLIKKKYLPKQVFTIGELYYTANQVPQQKSVVSYLIMSHTAEQMNKLLDDQIRFIGQLFQELQVPFVGYNLAPHNLTGAESKRIEFLAPNKVLLASIAGHRDFFSRRCEIFASTDATDTYRTLHFPHIATGTIDLEMTLKCLIERYTEKKVFDLLLNRNQH